MSGWEGKAANLGVARRLLHELVVQLQTLLHDDEPSHIDLMELELGEAGLALLRETLGEGEVVAEVENFGRVSVVQSGYAGIWWVTHMDEQGEVLSNFLEVSYCPEVLIADTEEVGDGCHALQARLFEMEVEHKHE